VKKFALGVGLAATTASAAILLSTAVANAGAPSVVGQKYSDASSALSSAKFTAKIGTRFGEGVSQGDCVVTSQRTESTPQNGSHSTSGTTVVLSLNCDPQEASATKAGYSAGSPEGRAAAAAASASAASATPTAAAGG
jgi:beta-lactam-binding protein with PASTA domain